VIDSEGYRPNVGIILCNAEGRLFWARRIGQHSWQFPQGGIRRDESPEQAMFRELAEEVGLRPEHVQMIGSTRGWLRYRLPRRLVRQGCRPPCIGQKQIWFLLRMRCGEDAVRLDLSEHPEFDLWQWVDYWYPLHAVVAFKRHVYWRALHELANFLPTASPLRRPVPAQDVSPALHDPENREVWPSLARPQNLEPPHLSAGIQKVTVLQMRQVEKSQNPVITRMVVTSRRLGALEKATTQPVLELSDAAGLDESREALPARTVPAGRRQWSPR